MRPLRAFLLGAAALGSVAYVAAAAVALAAAAATASLHVAVGPLVLVSVEREAGETMTTLGPGLAALALAGGIANLVAALVLQRRRGDRSPFA